MQTSNHILAKEGILTTFSIAKKVSIKDIKKIRDKMKNTKVDANKMQDLLKRLIVKETQSKIDTQKIPGIILDGVENVEDVEEKKRLMELTYFASIIAKKLSEKKIGKYHSCYIINAIVNMLGLTEGDFNEFHKKFSKFKDENGENSEESENGEEGGII
jgi:hypothetical protein